MQNEAKTGKLYRREYLFVQDSMNFVKLGEIDNRLQWLKSLKAVKLQVKQKVKIRGKNSFS